MAAKGEGDLIEDFAAAIPIEVIGNLLGVPVEERGPLRDWSLAILGALEPVVRPEVAARGNAAVTEFLGLPPRPGRPPPRRAARPRHLRADPADPGRGVGDRLTETELLHNCIFLLNAGHETTTNLIGNGLEALLRIPAEKAPAAGRSPG